MRTNRLASLFALGTTLAAAACSSREGPAEGEGAAAPAPVAVTAAAAQMRTLDRTVEVVGTLLPDEQVTLRSEIDGRVERVTADFGDRVRSGQILVQLDSQDQRLEVERAQAALQEALATLGLPPDGDESHVKDEDQAAVQRLWWQLEDARTKLESASSLLATKDIPEQRVLELQKEVKRLEAEWKQAKDQIGVQVVTVRQRRVELAQARRKLAKTSIAAPFEAGVAQRMVAPGDYVSDNTPVIMLIRSNPLRLRAAVPERGAAAVRKGLEVAFRTDAFPGRRFAAKVTDVSPVLDSASRALILEARYDNSRDLLKPGMFAQVEIVVAPKSPAVMVPRSAVLEFGGLHKVFVLGEDGRVTEKTVEVGLESEDWIEITDDSVQPGQRVATSALGQLAQGTAFTEQPSSGRAGED